MRDLTGKTALVTGASRGIGRAIAQRLGAGGALVAVHYASNDEAAQETMASIEQTGGRAFPIRARLGVDGDFDRLFAGLEAGLGGAPLNILVNNAGILDPTPFEQVTPEAFDRSYAVNARAPFFIIQRALPLLRDGGRIINVSSAVTRIVSPFTHYAMGKGAIDVLGLTLARALGPRGITVNTVTPASSTTPARAHGCTAARRSRRRSCRPPRWDGSGSPPTSPTWSRSSPPTTPVGSPASRSKPAAAIGSDRLRTEPRPRPEPSYPAPTRLATRQPPA
jgi:3-oxoacyl-[acyl-carrier protein] reductase